MSLRRVIGGWQCNANWAFMADRTFEISIPYFHKEILRIDKVILRPEFSEIRLFGTFAPNKISDTDITNGSSCWETQRRYASNGGTDGTP
jgi:hypothetical protein